MCLGMHFEIRSESLGVNVVYLVPILDTKK